jgi:hypothetical protein
MFKNIITKEEVEMQKKRSWFIKMLLLICGIGALVGLIPIKGFGSLCSDIFIYPLSFFFLSILHLVIIFMIRC